MELIIGRLDWHFRITVRAQVTLPKIGNDHALITS